MNEAGDKYIMVRICDGSNGVVYYGSFRSAQYEEDDWAGASRKGHYVDISILQPCAPDDPMISIEAHEAALPEIEWRRGHSGEILTEKQELKFAETFGHE